MIAGGIVTSNCRCLLIPVLDSKAFARILTYQEWLADKPAAAVQKILGPGRARLFSGGDLTLAEMVNPAGRKLTLEQLYRKVST